MPTLYTYETTWNGSRTDPGCRLFATPFQAESAMREACGSAVKVYDRAYSDTPDVYRHTVRPATWQERERALFDTHVYTCPVWEGERWWMNRPQEVVEHYTHVSLDDPSMVAFTASADHGERDRQTRMKPGKYLKRFFGDVLSDKRIAFYAEWFATGSKPSVDFEGTFGLATTGDEIKEVYAGRISSCMEGEDCVRVYAAGDLAIAYWTDPCGNYVARALCWPEKQIYGRIYPEPRDENAGVALRQAMAAKGWKDENVSDGGFNGARILKIDGDCGGWVMPYIDRQYGVSYAGKFWVMAKNGADYDCGSTSGYIGDDRRDCDHCGAPVHEDDTYVVALGYSERYGGGISHASYCESCYSARTYHCGGSDETFDDDVESVDVDGWTWCRGVANHAVALGNLFIDCDGNYTADEPIEDDYSDDDAEGLPAIPCPDTLPLPLEA